MAEAAGGMNFEVGIDIVEVERAGRLWREGSLKGAFSSAETAGLGGSDRLVAEALAVKEAVAKAFGTGFAEDVAWKDIEAVRRGRGWHINLHRGVERAAREGRLRPVVSSASQDGLAVALACLEPDAGDREERAED